MPFQKQNFQRTTDANFDSVIKYHTHYLRILRMASLGSSGNSKALNSLGLCIQVLRSSILWPPYIVNIIVYSCVAVLICRIVCSSVQETCIFHTNVADGACQSLSRLSYLLIYSAWKGTRLSRTPYIPVPCLSNCFHFARFYRTLDT